MTIPTIVFLIAILLALWAVVFVCIGLLWSWL